MKKLP